MSDGSQIDAMLRLEVEPEVDVIGAIYVIEKLRRVAETEDPKS